MKIKQKDLAEFYKVSTEHLRNLRRLEDQMFTPYASAYNKYKAYKAYYYLHACENEECTSNYNMLLSNIEALKEFIEKCEYKHKQIDTKTLEAIGLSKEEWGKKQKEQALESIKKIEEISWELS